MNFHEPLETDDAEEKVLKLNDVKRIEEVAPSPEMSAQNKFKNWNIETVSVDAMNEVIKEYTSDDTKMNDANTKVLNYYKSSTTNRKEVSKRANECNEGAGNVDEHLITSRNNFINSCKHLKKSNDESFRVLRRKQSKE